MLVSALIAGIRSPARIILRGKAPAAPHAVYQAIDAANWARLAEPLKYSGRLRCTNVTPTRVLAQGDGGCGIRLIEVQCAPP
jgi:hypothetical protein